MLYVLKYRYKTNYIIEVKKCFLPVDHIRKSIIAFPIFYWFCDTNHLDTCYAEQTLYSYLTSMLYIVFTLKAWFKNMLKNKLSKRFRNLKVLITNES